MAETTITRKDMKEPDRFQQAATQAASWIAARRKHVVLAGAIVIGLAIVLAVLQTVRQGREERAGQAASELLSTASGDISPVPLPGLPGPFFPSDEAKQRAIVEAARRVLAEHPGTGAALLASLTLGDAEVRLHAWDDAKAAYEQYLASAPPGDSLRFGALEGIAIAEEAKGSLDAAAATYERLGREVPAFADRAELERARILARAGKVADARAILGTFGERHKDSLLTADASQLLARIGAK